MRWDQVLFLLHLLNLTVTTQSGQLVVEGDVDQLVPRVVAGIIDNRDTLVYVLSGGHTWAPCTRCQRGLLLPVRKTDGKPRTVWPPCRLTTRCDGTHQPHQAQVDALLAQLVPAPPTQAKQPARPDHRRLLGPGTPYPQVQSTTTSRRAA